MAKNSDGAGFNELKGRQVGLLCEALESAIPEEDTLEQIMLFSLEEPLSNLSKANTHPALILNVVKWAQSQGKIGQLIIAASLKNPGNPLLQKFAKDHLQVILELSPLPKLNNNLLTSLLQVLTQIKDFREIVWLACLRTLPDIEISFPKLRNHLLNNEISCAVKWLILLDLFLITWECNDQDQPYIVLFVQNLVEFLSEGIAKTTLKQLLDALPESMRPLSKTSEPEIYPEYPSDEALKKLQAYFLITVEPLETSNPDKYGVNGYVITRLNNEDRHPQIESISLQLFVTQEANGSLKMEPYYTLEQVNHNLPDWLLKANELISNQGMEIKRKYNLESPPVADLTIEFWLPFEHLSTAAESWQIYDQPSRFKRRNWILGKKYRVVVRSYDRFSDPYALNELNRTWQSLVNLSQNLEDIATTVPNASHLDCWNDWTSLQKQLTQACLSLSLTCPLCAQDYKHQRENLFALMLEKGIPLVLWSRSVDLTDKQKNALKQKMQGMLTADTFNHLEDLFETIKLSRTVDTEERLALWCDEPKRLEELKDFREKGKLRA